MQGITPNWIEWRDNRRLALADRLGFFSLAGIALLGLSFSYLQRLAMILLLLAFLIAAWDMRHALIRSPLAWLVAIWLVYLTGHMLMTGLSQGWEAFDTCVETDHYARGSALVAILAGLWLRDDPNRARWLLGLALLGVLLWLGIYTDWAAIQQPAPGRRVFGDNPNRVALVMLITTLGLLTVGFGWAIRSTSMPTPIRWALGGLSVIGTLAALWVIWVTGSRQVLVACAVMLPVAVFLVVQQLGTDRRWSLLGKRLIFTILFIGLPISVVLVGLTSEHASDRLEHRVTDAVETVQDYWEDKEDTGTRGSTAQRLFILSTGWEAILERPLFGYGPINPDRWLSPVDQPHWHNLYLQLAVNFGIVGAVLFLSGFAYPAVFYSRKAQQAKFDPYIILFVVTSAVALAIMLLFTVRIHQSLGRWIITIIFSLMVAPIVSCWLTKSRRAHNDQDDPDTPSAEPGKRAT